MENKVEFSAEFNNVHQSRYFRLGSSELRSLELNLKRIFFDPTYTLGTLKSFEKGLRYIHRTFKKFWSYDTRWQV